jgi:hypothetical protein
MIKKIGLQELAITRRTIQDYSNSLSCLLINDIEKLNPLINNQFFYLSWPVLN